VEAGLAEIARSRGHSPVVTIRDSWAGPDRA
jgi:hypothetical protein